MSDLRVHRIVLVLPGANAQFTRRFHGIGKTIGCLTDVITDPHLLSSHQLAESSILLISKENLARLEVDVTKAARILVFSEQEVDFTSGQDRNIWRCHGNPVSSPHTSSILQLLLHEQLLGPRWTQTGWSSARYTVECALKNQARELAKICKTLRINNTPSVVTFLHAVRKIQSQAQVNCPSHVEIWCDGNTFSFEWNLASYRQNQGEFASLFHEITNSLHIVRFASAGAQSGLSISGRYLLGQDIGPMKGIVIIGTLSGQTELHDAIAPLGESA